MICAWRVVVNITHAIARFRPSVGACRVKAATSIAGLAVVDSRAVRMNVGRREIMCFTVTTVGLWASDSAA